MYVGLYFIYCFPVEGCSLAAERSILINYLVWVKSYCTGIYESKAAFSV